MGAKNRILRGLNRVTDILSNNTPREQRTGRMTQENVQNVDKAREEEVGTLKAQNADLVKQKEHLEDTLKEEEEIDIPRQMQSQQQGMIDEIYSGAVSLRNLFRYTENNKVDVRSRDYETQFGTFNDLYVLPNGSIAVSVQTENGEEQKPITGRTFRNIIANQKSMGEMVEENNVITLNLTSDGDYAPNIDQQEVPRVVIDDNDDIITTQMDREEFIAQLAEKERQINQLRQKVKSNERAWLNEHENRRDLEHIAELADQRAETAETGSENQIKQVNEMVQRFRTQEQEKNRLAHGKRLAEDQRHLSEQARDNILTKWAERFDMEEKDLAKEEMRDMLRFLTGEIAESLPRETTEIPVENSGETGE